MRVHAPEFIAMHLTADPHGFHNTIHAVGKVAVDPQEEGSAGWPHAIDRLGTSNKLCSQGLERFMAATAGMDRASMQVLPFIK